MNDIWSHIIIAILTYLLGLVTVYLKSYQKTKAALDAQKEKIGELTEITEEVKSKIGIEQHRTNIFNERKLVAIAEIYSTLVAFKFNLSGLQMVSQEIEDGEAWDKNVDRINDFVYSFPQMKTQIYKNFIFIDTQLIQNINNLFLTYSNSFIKDNDRAMRVLEEIEELVQDTGLEMREFENREIELMNEWNNCVSYVLQNIDPIIENLRSEFQNILISSEY